ncbi:MAG TPA: hypothetical protein PK733_18410 [Clostridiales bacterium]|nr:hypothetical protein [Clostridiales bacterium]
MKSILVNKKLSKRRSKAGYGKTPTGGSDDDSVETYITRNPEGS